MDAKNSQLRNGLVTKENIKFYEDFGYLVAPDFISANDIEKLKRETVEIFRGTR